MSESRAPNADQTTYWNEQGGLTWAELSALLDRQIEGVGRRAMEALAPRPGERLLDVGCGCGQTTLALAARVSPGGDVIGLDISRPMLEVARRRAAQDGVANIRFLEADAQTTAFEPAAFDGVYSRFGVMFFADPEAAFRNLLGALKPGGRLGFVCWRSLAENPWMTAPLAAAAAHMPPGPPPSDPDAPGPFAFADAERGRRILAAAGFTDIELTPVQAPIGGNSLPDSVTVALRVGPLGARLRENPELRPKVVEAVRDALAPSLRDGEVWMAGAVWVVTARRA
jgi:SAM-dependent methyltransferase